MRLGTVGHRLGSEVMTATASRLAVLVVLSFLALITLRGSGNPLPSTPIQRLQVRHTSAGPIITGLFVDAEYVVPASNCKCTCYSGSNNPTSCYSNTRETCTQACYPCMTTSICFDVPSDASCCQCTQTCCGSCVGCPTTGSGCSRGC